MECDALKILVQVLDSSSNSNSSSSNSSSSTDHDSLIKYVPLSFKLLAAALGVRNPYNNTERTPDCDDKHPEHLDETSAGSVTVHSTTEASKMSGNKSIRNEHGSFFFMYYCMYSMSYLNFIGDLIGGYHVSGQHTAFETMVLMYQSKRCYPRRSFLMWQYL